MRGEDVSFTDVKIKIPGPGDVNDVMHWKHEEDLGDFEKVVELRTRNQTRRVNFRGLQRPDEFGRYRCQMRWRADGKVIIERLCISRPYVETFNSKVIKGFVPDLRSHYVFFMFRDSYVLCIYVTNILCTFHISVSGYGTLGDGFVVRAHLPHHHSKT